MGPRRAGSVGKVLAMQARGSEFRSQTPIEKLCGDLSVGVSEIGGSLKGRILGLTGQWLWPHWRVPWPGTVLKFQM